MLKIVISVLVAIIAIFLLSLDGIMATSSKRARKNHIETLRMNRKLRSKISNAEPAQEYKALKQRKEKTTFPREVTDRGGFTGRGSPFLTRYKYRSMEAVEKDIERIIRS